MVDAPIEVEDAVERPAPPAGAAAAPVNGHDRRPLIRLSVSHVHEQATRAERHLMNAGVPFYERGGRIVRPISDRVAASGGRITHTAALVEVEKVYLRDMMNQKIRWGAPCATRRFMDRNQGADGARRGASLPCRRVGDSAHWRRDLNRNAAPQRLAFGNARL